MGRPFGTPGFVGVTGITGARTTVMPSAKVVPRFGFSLAVLGDDPVGRGRVLTRVLHFILRINAVGDDDGVQSILWRRAMASSLLGSGDVSRMTMGR